MALTPAFVLNGRGDVLAANDLGITLFSPLYANPARPANTASFVFLDQSATEFLRDTTRSPTTPWPYCAPRPAATPTTGTFRT